MAKRKGASVSSERSPEMLQKIVETLFPRHDARPWAPIPYGQTGQSEVTPVTNDELLAIAKSLKLNKVLGPDGIPTGAIKAAIEACSEWLCRFAKIGSTAQTREATWRPVGKQTYPRQPGIA